MTWGLPKLGPRTHMGEDRLEQYDGCCNMRRAVSHKLSGSRWQDKFQLAGGIGAQAEGSAHPYFRPNWTSGPWS
ncbi:hypothetical protein HO173_004702 [Letharia columbiana]|uniref:Uncharacterized protein n=1 Tax=Letharia columbiana TaxID=112416 RepID=A0A8H6FYK4_9LECA|nr:uncharacterized protein HO173_004702 [Letharia columbiana]KAF6237234.1 hypothetical protein HO173_004702 [Letharia columbiana]